MRWWKWVGLAGLVGVAAAGAVTVKRHRARAWNDYTPEELRGRLRERLRVASVAPPGGDDGAGTARG